MVRRPSILVLFILSIEFMAQSLPVFASDISLYGNLSAYGLGYFENDSCLSQSESAQVSTVLPEDMNLSIDIGDMAFIYNQFTLTGILSNQEDQGITYVSPVSINVNQLYLQVPIANIGSFYCGKRIKQIGTAQAFSLVNRINPIYFNNVKYSNLGAGLLEADFYPVPWGGAQFLLFFKDLEAISKWEDLDMLGILDFTMNPVRLGLYAYSEEFDDYPIGVSGSFQLDSFTFYAEYLYKRKSECSVVIDGYGVNPADDIVIREAEGYHSVVGGCRYSAKGIIANLEYFYNADGLSGSESGVFKDYINQSFFDDTQKMMLIKAYRSQKKFMKNYLSVDFSWSSVLGSDFSVNLNSITSFNGLEADERKYIGSEMGLSLTYAIKQGVQAMASGLIRFGGSDSEYVLYERQKAQVNLGISMEF